MEEEFRCDIESKIENESKNKSKTFSDLGISDVLCDACERLNWINPTKIQCEAIPLALNEQDVIGLAETGSGKTGAFALPILHSLLATPQKLFALILTPTRELAFQIAEQFEALGTGIGLKVAVIVGGIDMMTQAMSLAKRPHIIVATPGRMVDHLENTKGFNLRALKFLVMDEADRILNMDFEVELDKILKVIPKQRRTFLFSATMTKKVAKLQRASLKNPVKVEVSDRYQTVEKLRQHYIFIPAKYKVGVRSLYSVYDHCVSPIIEDVYLVWLLNDMSGNSFIVFCGTCANTMRTAILLRNLGFSAVPLHGQMGQEKRLGALGKFRSKSRSILLATDVASRGLDIPHVDVVVNMDVPTHSKDYIHRVGRTARAGKGGLAITLVSQYDVELYQRIETLLNRKLPLYPIEEQQVLLLLDRVTQAQTIAKQELKELEDKKRKGNKRGKRRDSEHEDQDDMEYKKPIHKGISDVLCDVFELLNWINPTKIQYETIPLALNEQDVIGLA